MATSLVALAALLPAGAGAQDRPPEAAGTAENARAIAASRLGACIRKPPEYPIEARRQDLEGQTVVAFRIDAQGEVGEPSILRPSRHPVLDQAALAHVKACIAQSAGAAAEPLPPGRYALPMVWRLE